MNILRKSVGIFILFFTVSLKALSSSSISQRSLMAIGILRGVIENATVHIDNVLNVLCEVKRCGSACTVQNGHLSAAG